MPLSPRFLIALCLAASSAAAQCNPPWLPGHALPGTDGTIYAMTRWDPDGPGPADELVVIGGDFTVAGNQQTQGIAAYNPRTSEWSRLGAGMGGEYPVVQSLAATPDGSIVAGGFFTMAGGTPANRIARWNGTAWSAMGMGMSEGDGSFDPCVTALTTLSNGDIIAGGNFRRADGVVVNSVARWNGASWLPLPGAFGGRVDALLQHSNGTLVVGGDFSGDASDTWAFQNIASWDGASWSPLGLGIGNYKSNVYALTEFNGELVAGGDIRSTDPDNSTAFGVMRWDGVNWSPMGSGFGELDSLYHPTVYALAIVSDNLVAAGDFWQVEGLPARSIVQWSNSGWTPLDGGIGRSPVDGDPPFVRGTTVLPDGALFAGGSFNSAGGQRTNNLAVRAGSAAAHWSAPGRELNAPIETMDQFPNGDLVLGGRFTTAGGVAVPHIARGRRRTTRGPREVMDPVANWCTCLCAPNGDVFAEWEEGSPFGVSRMSRWDGTAWTRIDEEMEVYASTMEVAPNGDLLVGGRFGPAGGQLVYGIARWNGSAWSDFDPDFRGDVRDMELLPGGDLIAVGTIGNVHDVPMNNVARWNGAVWSSVGSGSYSAVRTVVCLPNGNIVIGGDLHYIGGADATGAAEWDGSEWRSLSSGLQWDTFFNSFHFVHLPNNHLIAAGAFDSVGGSAANNIAYWDGSSWSAIGEGLQGFPYNMAHATGIEVLPNGDVAVCGNFAIAGTEVSPFFARIASPVQCACDTIDFNHDGLLPDTLDIADFLNVFAGGVCDGQQPADPPCNTDIDFNNDTLFPDVADIQSLLSVFGGGSCV